MQDKTIEQQIAELEAKADAEPQSRAGIPIGPDTKLSVLWAKVSPFVMLLTNMVSGKVKRYLEAFSAAINTLVAKEEEEEPAGEV